VTGDGAMRRTAGDNGGKLMSTSAYDRPTLRLDEAQRLIASGLSVATVAERMGIRRQTLSKAVSIGDESATGTPRRTGKPTPLPTAEIMRLSAMGLNATQVAAQLGLRDRTVRRIVVRERAA
jgi:plasmid maintenance system antidote protein VapI